MSLIVISRRASYIIAPDGRVIFGHEDLLNPPTPPHDDELERVPAKTPGPASGKLGPWSEEDGQDGRGRD